MYRFYYPKDSLMDNDNSNDYENNSNNYSNTNNYCFANSYYNRSNTNSNEPVVYDYNYAYYQRYDYFFNRQQDINYESAFNYQQSTDQSFDSNCGLRNLSSDLTDLDDTNIAYYSHQNLPQYNYNNCQYNYLNESNNRFDLHHQRSDFPKSENEYSMPNTIRTSAQLESNQYNPKNNYNALNAMQPNSSVNSYHSSRSPKNVNNRQTGIPHTYTPSITRQTSSTKIVSNQSPNSYSLQFSSDPMANDKYFEPQILSTQSSTCSPNDSQANSSFSICSSLCSPDSSIQTLSQSSISTSSESSVTKLVRNQFKKDLLNEGHNKDMRLQIKRERNREAAAKCRKKKLKEIGVLEERKCFLISENHNLENEVKLMRETVFEMKQLLLNHRIEGTCKIYPKKA